MSGNTWKPDLFEIAMPPGPRMVAGYTYRGLGLHIIRNGSPKGGRKPRWSLSHLGTGHKLAVLDGDVRTVFTVASDIAEAGDWTFDGLYGWKNQFPNAKEELERIINESSIGTLCFGPKHSEESRAVAMQIAASREGLIL